MTRDYFPMSTCYGSMNKCGHQSVNYTTDQIQPSDLNRHSHVPTQEHARTVFVDNVYWHQRGH
jgi:hypothetical protein